MGTLAGVGTFDFSKTCHSKPQNLSAEEKLQRIRSILSTELPPMIMVMGIMLLMDETPFSV